VSDETPAPPGPSGPSLTRLAASPPPLAVEDVIAALQSESAAREHLADRPYVSCNMVCSVDGRATLGTRSGGLSSPADRALFHGLRSITDAVLVGAGTVRDERYGRIIPDPDTRARRTQAGLSPEPLACVVSASVALDPALPLLAEPDARVVVVTASLDRTLEAAAHVDYVRARDPEGHLDLAAALRELRTRFDVRELLCEGGPSINGRLLQVGLIDELHLSFSPVLAGGDDEVMIVAAEASLRPTRLTLADVNAADSFLFLRYRIDHDHPLP
jgi:5-amino-6-(5-phosphoribosylamino)uracil reductase